MRRPLIGINSESIRSAKNCLGEWLDLRYMEAVEKAGGIPVQINSFHDHDQIPRMLERLDGVVLSGGDDLDPAYWGTEAIHPKAKLVPREKQSFDFALAKECLRSGIPVLGICYGMQVLSTAAGGKMFQDIAASFSEAAAHKDAVHQVLILPGTKLRRILNTDQLPVRSSHHQAVSVLGEGFRACATSEDGLLEAFEGNRDSFALGVQWHPELNPETPKLFEAFVEETLIKQP